METVIRSPQKGVIAKLVHKEGVSTLYYCPKNSTDWFEGHMQSWNCACII